MQNKILIIVGAPLAAPDVNTPKSKNDITEKAGAASGAPTRCKYIKINK